LHDGQINLFDDVPSGLAQHGLIINAPQFGANWLIGGRPGQGQDLRPVDALIGARSSAELWIFAMGETTGSTRLHRACLATGWSMEDAVAADTAQALDDR
jgi:S-DNA-T family DNA segregation ATPase FtsK/SpoIIIE